jgi:hypothetical protein
MIMVRDADLELLILVGAGMLVGRPGVRCSWSSWWWAVSWWAGAEPEITLTELETITSQYADPSRVADAIIASVKHSQPACKPPTRAALTKGPAGFGRR